MTGGGKSGYLSGIVVHVDEATRPARVYVATNAHGFRGFDPRGQSGDVVVVYPATRPPIYIDRIHYMGNPDSGIHDDIAIVSGPSSNPPSVARLATSDPTAGESVRLMGYPKGLELSAREAVTTATNYRGGAIEFNQHAVQGMSGGPVYVGTYVGGLIAGDLVHERGCLAVPITRVRAVLRDLFPRLAMFADQARIAAAMPRVAYQPQLVAQIAGGCSDLNSDGYCDQNGQPLTLNPPTNMAPPPAITQQPPTNMAPPTYGGSFDDGPETRLQRITPTPESMLPAVPDPVIASEPAPIRERIIERVGSAISSVTTPAGETQDSAWPDVAVTAIIAAASVAGIGIPAWAVVAWRGVSMAKRVRDGIGRRGSADDDGFL